MALLAPACALLPPDEPLLDDLPPTPGPEPPFEVVADPPVPLPLFWLPLDDALLQLRTSAATAVTVPAEDSTEKRKRRVMGLGNGLRGDRAVLRLSA